MSGGGGGKGEETVTAEGGQQTCLFIFFSLAESLSGCRSLGLGEGHWLAQTHGRASPDSWLHAEDPIAPPPLLWETCWWRARGGNTVGEGEKDQATKTLLGGRE